MDLISKTPSFFIFFINFNIDACGLITKASHLTQICVKSKHWWASDLVETGFGELDLSLFVIYLSINLISRRAYDLFKICLDCPLAKSSFDLIGIGNMSYMA